MKPEVDLCEGCFVVLIKEDQDGGYCKKCLGKEEDDFKSHRFGGKYCPSIACADCVPF